MCFIFSAIHDTIPLLLNNVYEKDKTSDFIYIYIYIKICISKLLLLRDNIAK